MALVLMAKEFKLNYSTPTNNNQRISSNPHNRQIAQLEFDFMAAVMDLDGIEEVNTNCILMANLQQALASGTQTNKAPVYDSDESVKVYNYDNYYDNEIFNMFTQEERYTELLEPILEPHQVQQNDSNVISEVSSMEQDGRTIDQHPVTVEETPKEFDFMAAVMDLDGIEEVNTNCILMANLQQALASGTQTNKAPVYDSDESVKVYNYDNCYDNEIFNMFTQEERYIELLEPILEPHQVQQNDSNVIFEVSSMEQDGRTIDQHPVTVEETRAYFKSLYNNLAIKVKKEKKAKLFNEWERFTSNEGESIESYYHRFLKLINDLKRNKHFSEKITSNLKFLNNLQLEWSRHVTIVHQTKDLHTANYTQLYDFLKYNQKEVDELKAERIAKTQGPLALMANSNNPYVFPAPHQDQSSFNQNYLQQPMPNPEDITDLITAMNMALTLMAKAFKLNYSTPTNNNQRISSNPRNRQIAQPGMNMGQDRQMQMIGGNGGNQFRQYAGQNAGNTAGYNDVIGNQNQIGNGNLVAARAEGNAARQNGNQIRCYNCRGIGHYARNCTARPKRRDTAYLQTQLLIAHKEEAEIQLQAEEYDLMAVAADLDEIKEVNANCILMANLQQASTSEEQYTELLEPIPESHQVPQNDNDVISEDTSVEQGGEIVEQHPANFEETCALYESLYQNLAFEVKKVNSVNHKLKETNADLTTELARFKNQKGCFEISQGKYDKLEKCYQQSVYQEQCLSKKNNALHLSTGKQIMTLNKQISDLNKQLSKEKSTVSFLLEEKKKLKSDFKTCNDKLLDKQIQLEKRIKELNNIVLKMGQSIQTIHMLSSKPNSLYNTEQKMALGYQNPFYLKQAQKKQQSLYDGKVLLEKHDPPVVHDSEEALQLAQESRDKMKQMYKEIKLANYTKINHLLGVFVPQTALSREELSFSNSYKTTNVSKSFLIPNEDLSDDTTPSVARVDNNAKTRRLQPRSNTKNDRVSFASKSSYIKNKEVKVEVEEHTRNLLLSKNKKHMSS
nr:hypothetical protein [Tanacetum cinerariifolium]